MTRQPESRLSRAILDHLAARGAFAFKVHGGPTMMAGLPDIVACVPVPIAGVGTVGLFVGLETKMPGNVPSAIQNHRHDQIRDAGGGIVVPHSVTEAREWLDRYVTTPGRR